MTLLVAFSAPLFLLLGLVAVPILILFLLKRRYREQSVSSTMLWVEVLEDVLARSPFRTPTEWLSLILLLLAVAAGTLAAAGMRMGLGGGDRQALVMVIDTSASMATVDEEGDTRLERAREVAAETVGGLRSGDVVLCVAAGAETRIASHASDDLDRVGAVVDELRVEAATADLVEALELAVREAKGLQVTVGAVEIQVYSDFAANADALIRLDTEGLPVTLVECGEPADNAGIVHAALSGGADDGRLLVTVAYRGESSARRTLSLYRDDTLVDAREVELAPGRETGEVFPVRIGAGEDSVRYRAALEPADSLPLDDEVRVGVTPNDPPRVLIVGEEDPFLSRLPRVFPGLSVARVRAAELAEFLGAVERPFELAILTESPPVGVEVPAARELYLGCPPAGLDVTLGSDTFEALVLEWDRGHPWLRGVGFEALLVLSANPLTLPSDARTLLTTSAGPQLAVIEREDRSVALWASTMDSSNLVLIPAFPLLLRNILGASLGGLRGDVHAAAEPLKGTAGLGRFQGTVEIDITSPSGATQTSSLWSREEFFWQGRTEPGWYTLRARPESGGDELVRHLGVNLLSREETTLAIDPPEADAFPATGVQTVAAQDLQTERPVWRWLVLACILALFAESLVWSRVLRRQG